MELSIYAEGSGFRGKSDLKSVIDLLSGYEVAFGYCLQRASISRDVIPRALHPKIRLRTMAPGSLDIRLVTDLAAAITPLAPQIFGQAWQLYKAGYDLIAIATKYFNEKGAPMTITISDSPGATVNVINGHQVNTSPEVLKTAVHNHKFLDKIAGLIKIGKADRITMGANHPEPFEQLEFNRTNKNSFHLPSIDMLDETPIEFECSIYRFNKKTLKGYLEYYDREDAQIIPFETSRPLLDDCLDAFKADRASVSAQKEISTNALGEIKIKKFHLLSINTITE
jgi:hypothetical protein